MSSVPAIATALLQMQASCTASGLLAQWETCANGVINAVQDNALNGRGDEQAEAIAWLQANRKFLRNTGGSNHDLSYNGETFTFDAGVAYCAAPNEVNLFVDQAASLGYSIVEVDYTTWVANQSGTSYYFQ